MASPVFGNDGIPLLDLTAQGGRNGKQRPGSCGAVCWRRARGTALPDRDRNLPAAVPCDRTVPTARNIARKHGPEWYQTLGRRGSAGSPQRNRRSPVARCPRVHGRRRRGQAPAPRCRATKPDAAGRRRTARRDGVADEQARARGPSHGSSTRPSRACSGSCLDRAGASARFARCR